MEADITSDNISLIYTNGPIYPPFDVTVIWTDEDGNQETCTNLCDLEDVFTNIEPGRYCVQIIIEDYFLHPDNDLALEDDYFHELFSITKCFDLEGSTCGTTGTMSESSITCLSTSTGTVSFDGELAPCLKDQNGLNNAKLTWSTGRTNTSPLTPLSEVTSIDNLTPGKYCVKITPFNSQNGACDCVAYYCTEIGSLEAEPLSINARITPMKICYIDGFPSWILEQGSIRVSGSGGWAPGGYSFRWIGNAPPSAIPPTGDNFRNEFRYCVEVTDECENKLTKCFTIPKIRVDCNIHDPNDDGREGKVSQNEPANIYTLDRIDEQKLQTVTENSINLYPIPASNELHLEFSTKLAKTLKFSIYSVNGLEIKNGFVLREQKENKTTIDISEMPSGVYYLCAEGFPSKKIIIIH